MIRKIIKKTSNEKQSNDTSNIDSISSEENNKKSNRGCLGIRKPSWFLWNIFPKDGQPPTQSLFEIAIYLLFIVLLCFLFVKCNTGPEYHISYDFDTLNNFRYLSNDKTNDSVYYLHFQRANICTNIPMRKLKSHVKKALASFNFDMHEDSIRILRSDISKYFDRVNTLNDEWNYRFKDAKLNTRDSLISNYNGFDYLFYGFEYSTKDSSLIKKLNYFREHSIYFNQDKRLHSYCIKISSKVASLLPFDNIIYKHSKIGEIDESQGLMKRYFETEKDINVVIENYRQDIFGIIEGTDSINWFLPGNYVLNWRYDNDYLRVFPTEPPTLIDPFDISQARYNIEFKSTTIDSLFIKFDFHTATDFYTFDIKPDETGSNFIIFSDPQKIKHIKMKGLTFYANFKELENIQMIRVFSITALLSGLLIILLTFLILGIYRSAKAFRNRDKI